jgi:hypothetical protein
MKNTLLIYLFLIGIFSATAQVGIGTTNPHTSSALDITSTNSGILIPRMTFAQRNAITSPATGLMVFQTDNTPGFYYFEGTWKPFAGNSKWTAAGNDIYNANSGNVGVGTATPTTKLHVEKSGGSTGPFSQGFESGLAPMTSGGSVWTSQSTNVRTGARSARSGAIGNSAQTSMFYSATVPAGGATLSFWYTVDSELNYDFLKFYIDGAQVGIWSGNLPYTQFTTPLSAGPHTFEWRYVKDISASSGLDSAFIDDVAISNINIYNPAFRLVDGSQASGKVLISDALGNARWDQLTNSSIADIPLIAAFGGMVIPICDAAFVGQTGNFSINIKGIPTTVNWEVLQRITAVGSTATISGVEVLVAPFDAERLQVRYDFSPLLPFSPNGLIFSANNNTFYPDTFTLNYAAKSTSSMTMNITRNDKFGDTGSNCWQGQFYFDVFMTN